MCLRDFPNSSELARAGSGPLKPSELIHCWSEKSTFHCFPLRDSSPPAARAVLESAEEEGGATLFLLLEIIKGKGTRDEGSSAD